MQAPRPMRMAATAAVAALLPLVAGSPARAACAPSADFVNQAGVVFVGTMTDASDDGSVARFDVEDVWKSGGLVLASPVSIQGQPGQFSMAPPDAGAQVFLVLADAVDGAAVITGDSCASGLISWDVSYLAFRPVDTPSASGEGGDAATRLPGQLIALMAAVATLGIVAFVAFRGRPRPEG